MVVRVTPNMRAALLDVAEQLKIPKTQLVRYAVNYVFEELGDPGKMKRIVDSLNNGKSLTALTMETIKETEAVRQAKALKKVLMA
jgi:hypothetical protein